MVFQSGQDLFTFILDLKLLLLWLKLRAFDEGSQWSLEAAEAARPKTVARHSPRVKHPAPELLTSLGFFLFAPLNRANQLRAFGRQFDLEVVAGYARVGARMHGPVFRAVFRLGEAN